MMTLAWLCCGGVALVGVLLAVLIFVVEPMDAKRRLKRRIEEISAPFDPYRRLPRKPVPFDPKRPLTPEQQAGVDAAIAEAERQEREQADPPADKS